MRKTSLDEVFKSAKKDERIFFIGSDLGVGTLQDFKETIPERFFVEGISEANVLGMAAGLALEGKIVYVNTIAPFFTRRGFEQIVLDLCLHNVNVRLIANGGGLVYTPLGPTHEVLEDFAVLRPIPNITIVAVADADEMRRLMPLTVDYQGPIYIRLAKGYDPIVTKDEHSFEIGKGILHKEGKDVLIITTGITLQLALEASERLEKVSISVSLLHLHTIKPLDVDAILTETEKVQAVVTIEEHYIIGGLGSAVAEIIAETDHLRGKRFRRIGVPDKFAAQYGSQKSLMEMFGVSVKNLEHTIMSMLSK